MELKYSGLECEHCGKPLMMRTVMGFGRNLDTMQKCECVIEREAAAHLDRVTNGRPMVVTRRKSEAGLKKRQQMQTFESSKPRQGQGEAFRQAMEYADSYPGIRSGLMMSGGVGGGKTHLSAAIVNRIIEKMDIPDELAENEVWGMNLGFRSASGIVFTSALDLISEIKQSFDTDENTQGIVDRCTRAKLLVLDDLGTERPTDWVLERLFEIIDHRYNEMLPTVVTTNATPEELKKHLGDRIFDRLREMCKMVPVNAKSQRVTA